MLSPRILSSVIGAGGVVLAIASLVIGNGTNSGNGQVEVGGRWRSQKWGAHAKTADNRYNDYGIGICLVGNFDVEKPSAAQTQNLNKLVRFLCRRYNIPANKVYTHGGVTRQTRCPGKHFDLKALRRAAR